MKCRLVKVFSLALCLAMLLCACGGEPSSSGSSASSSASSGSTSDTGTETSEPIRIGSMFPRSGSLAMLGQESARGAELALEKINAEGGINGRLVEWVPADGVDADVARTEAERLITQEGVDIIFGSYSSAISIAASDVAESYGKVYFEAGGVSDAIMDRDFQYLLRVIPGVPTYCDTGVAFVVEEIAPRLGKDPSDLRIAVMTEDSSYGASYGAGYENSCAAAGLNIVFNETYSSTATDFSAMILKLKEAKPDVLFAVSYINDATLIWQQMKQLGFSVDVMIGGGAGHSMTELYDAVGGCAGLYSMDPCIYAINKEFCPGIDDFLDAYKAKYGSEPISTHSLIHYSGALELFDLIEAAGCSLEADDIMAAALTIQKEPGTTVTGVGVKYDGPDGALPGQNNYGHSYVAQWDENRNLKTVYPKNAAIADPVVPMTSLG